MDNTLLIEARRARRALPALVTLPALLSALAWGAFAAPAVAQSTGTTVAIVVQVQGDVRLEGATATAGRSFAGGQISTGDGGRLQMRLQDGTMLAVAPRSELRLPLDGSAVVALSSGGLRLSPAGIEWRVDLPDRSIRTLGYLKLQTCAAGCSATAGLYGRVAQADAVLEYQGGRTVLRNRSFRWGQADQRPEVLTTAPALLDDAGNQQDAVRARTEVAALLKSGIEAFGAGRDDEAVAALNEVNQRAPGESLVSYYLGLIALKREDNENALRLLQRYAREDPEGAATREVPKTLTLLSSAQLQQEVATAVSREKEVAATPPEPGSIAVQAFVNRGSDAYRAMAKGLAAMIIADLSKVPGLKVLEREKVQLLVDELRLSDSGLADPASAVRSGRLMRAEKVVVGNFEVQ